MEPKKDVIIIKKYINDNIYGGIGFTENEFKIVNTPTFQRLRRIKQQGLISYTFPSSEHTRFSHSIGVLYIMGIITEQLRSIGAINYQEQKELRYAALLHDIGHYPLSHLTEAVYNSIPLEGQGKYVSSHDEDTYKKFPLWRFCEKPKPKFAHHERLGAEVIKLRKDIREILEKDDCDVQKIGEIITGDTSDLIAHQCMHSNFDADRLDYLLRDSAAAGVNYGNVDLDYLIRLMYVGVQQNVSKELESLPESMRSEYRVIGINEKGLHVLEHYLMARYFSYAQVTLHRTASVFESLAKTLIYDLAVRGDIHKDYKEIQKIIESEDFLAFDDSYIWQQINPKLGKKKERPYDNYQHTLIERNRIKILLEEKIICLKNELIPADSRFSKIANFFKDSEGVERFVSEMKIDSTDIGYIIQGIDIDFSRDEIDKKSDKEAEATRTYYDGKCYYLADCESSIIRSSFDKELKILRVFYIDPFYNNDEESNRLKTEANFLLEKYLK
jgi:HD superfamily phosphohydrolase